MIPVVMSGGSGTRLWPFSRSRFPKQFCEIFEESLHRLTLRRLSQFGVPWVITNKVLQNLANRDLREFNIPTENVIFEPTSKNTAPAIAVLCSLFNQIGKQSEVVGVFPADHLISKEEEFKAAIVAAEAEARSGKIVTLGVRPDHPSTGYGYIQVENREVTSLALKV